MHSDDDIQYALEMTRVLHEPDRRIDTFGSTKFEFRLVTELMDNVHHTRVRNGRIEADKPLLITPNHLNDVAFDGFGDEAKEFLDWVRRRGADLSFLQYGFRFSKSDVTENLIHEPLPDVCDRVLEEARKSGNPLTAVIHGVDDTWEICLLKFTLEMIQKSHGINIFDFKRRGLL